MGFSFSPENLRRERTARGWTQRQIADRLRVSPAAVSLWESGQAEPSDSRRRALADMFDNREPDPTTVDRLEAELARLRLRVQSMGRDLDATRADVDVLRRTVEALGRRVVVNFDLGRQILDELDAPTDAGPDADGGSPSADPAP